MHLLLGLFLAGLVDRLVRDEESLLWLLLSWALTVWLEITVELASPVLLTTEQSHDLVTLTKQRASVRVAAQV